MPTCVLKSNLHLDHVHLLETELFSIYFIFLFSENTKRIIQSKISKKTKTKMNHCYM